MNRRVRRAKGGDALEAAVAAHRAGRLREAEALYRQVLAARPGHADALHLLGLVRNQRGHPAEAVELITRAVQLNPGEARYHNNLGLVHAGTGQADAAGAAYRQAIALDPDYVEPLINQATLLAGEGRAGEAEASLGRALALAPENASIHNNLGNVLKDLNRSGDAAGSYRRALALDPRYAEALGNLSVALTDLGELEEAEACCRRAILMRPEAADAHNRLGTVLKFLGDLDGAREAYARTLALEPGHPQALYSMTQLTRAVAGDPAFGAMATAAAAPGVAPDDAVSLNFGLGKMYADIGEPDTAFAHYEQGNALYRANARRLGRAFDAGRHERTVERIRSLFTAEFFAARGDFGAGSELPVFIVGMPRSGTTLVEQIIASHGEVFGAGELPGIPRAIARLGTKTGADFPESANALDAATSGALAREVVESLRALGGDAARVTDKLPMNFMNLGVIALLMPRARVIHCMRDARDTCLSCYFGHFTRGNEFAYDLADLGASYRAYERLMAHWREALPLAMLELDYEELVTDQEGMSRKLIAFCGLEWDPRCLQFHDHARPVQTASYEQVRRKMYASSVGRWRAYERHLAPLIEALGARS
jgi:tetratricopeptide (TPR) repeat protein